MYLNSNVTPLTVSYLHVLFKKNGQNISFVQTIIINKNYKINYYLFYMSIFLDVVI